MRDLTRQELEEYFEFLATAPRRSFDEQALLVGRTAIATGLLEECRSGLHKALEKGEALETIMVAAWAWAFQLGRECESRRKS